MIPGCFFLPIATILSLAIHNVRCFHLKTEVPSRQEIHENVMVSIYFKFILVADFFCSQRPPFLLSSKREVWKVTIPRTKVNIFSLLVLFSRYRPPNLCTCRFYVISETFQDGSSLRVFRDSVIPSFLQAFETDRFRIQIIGILYLFSILITSSGGIYDNRLIPKRFKTPQYLYRCTYAENQRVSCLAKFLQSVIKLAVDPLQSNIFL